MDQIRLVDEITPNSVIGARSSAVFQIRKDSTSISIYAFGRRVTFPMRADEALRFALSQSRFYIRDLPGNLDESGKLVLIRRLVREGLVLVLAA